MPSSLGRRSAAVAIFGSSLVGSLMLAPAAVGAPVHDTCTVCVADEVTSARTKPGAKVDDPNAISAVKAAALGNPKVRPMLPVGSVTIDTVFHVETADAMTSAERARMRSMITRQVEC